MNIDRVIGIYSVTYWSIVVLDNYLVNYIL